MSHPRPDSTPADGNRPPEAPVVAPSPIDALLLATLQELLEWEGRMGGFEAAVWERARHVVAQATPRPGSRVVGRGYPAGVEATPFFPRPPTACVVIPPGPPPESLAQRLRALEAAVAHLRGCAPHALYELFCGPFHVHARGTERDMRAIEEFLTDYPEHGDLHFPHPCRPG